MCLNGEKKKSKNSKKENVRLEKISNTLKHGEEEGRSPIDATGAKLGRESKFNLMVDPQ
jgi:hypothetical protein